MNAALLSMDKPFIVIVLSHELQTGQAHCGHTCSTQRVERERAEQQHKRGPPGPDKQPVMQQDMATQCCKQDPAVVGISMLFPCSSTD